MSYLVGETVLIGAKFSKSIDNLAFDPGSVTCTVIAPDTQVTYTYPASVTRTAVGSYQLNCVPTVPGKWAYRWEGLDTQNGVMEGVFFVEPITA